jgi:hypothetical protein
MSYMEDLGWIRRVQTDGLEMPHLKFTFQSSSKWVRLQTNDQTVNLPTAIFALDDEVRPHARL